MIVVDTSAVMAILLDEPEAQACSDALEAADAIAASVGTVAECMVVSSRRSVRPGLEKLLQGLAVEVVPLDLAGARRVGDAHAAWGKGGRVSALNFGDCFAYALAKERNCPLLYVGTDFPRTDIRSALP